MGTLLCVEILPRTSDRPSDVLASADDRPLSIGLISIEVKGKTSHRANRYVLADDPKGFERIYGIGHSESWGAWCVGPRALFLLEHDCNPEEEVLLTFHHQTFVQDRVCDLIVDATRFSDLRFEGQALSISYARPGHKEEVRSSEPSEIVSVVLVAYHCRAITACAALKTMGDRVETIIVDNGSDDDVLLSLEQALPAKLVRLRHRRAFGEANTFGIAQATGAKICLLNNDAFPQPGCLSILADVLDREKAIGFVAPILLNVNGSVQECGADVDEAGHVHHRTGELFDLQAPKSLHADVDFVSAACLMFEKDTFDRLGGFDPSFAPAYNEDADICLRLRRLGLGLAVVSDALCIHLRNTTLAALQATTTIGWPQSSHLVFVAKYKRWIAGRNVADIPAGPGPLQTPALTASARKVVINIADDDAALKSGVMLAAELSGSFQVEIRSEGQVSAKYLVFTGHNLGFRLPPPSVTEEGVALADTSASFVLTSSDFPPALKVKLPASARCWLFCPFPVEACIFDQALMNVVDFLSRCDRIVTLSPAGASAIRAIASAKGLPIPPIEIIPPVAIKVANDGVDLSERTILALVDPCSSVSLERIASVFEQTTQLVEDGTSWRLVIVVPFSPYPRMPRCSARHDVLLHATSGEISGRISRSGIVINALSPAYEVESLRYTEFALRSTPCVIVRRGSGAEALCEDAGCGWRFRDEASLAISLRRAVQDQGLSKTPPPAREAGPTFREAWTALLENSAPHADALPSSVTQRPRSAGREAFIVCGMHRSGTSAMARLLSIGGCVLPRTLMAPAPDNPLGFWESNVIAAFNDRVLTMSKSSWRDVFFRRESFPEYLVEEATDLLKDEFEGDGPCVLKDPRISLVHPLWSAAFQRLGWRPHYVLLCREPRDVAMSLYKREKMNPRHALLLWAAYMSSSLIGLRERSFSVVLYDALILDPLTTVERVFKEADCEPPMQDIEFEIAVRSFVQGSRVPSRFAYPSSFAPVDRLFMFLQSSWSEQDVRSAYQAGLDVRAWFERASRACRQLDRVLAASSAPPSANIRSSEIGRAAKHIEWCEAERPTSSFPSNADRASIRTLVIGGTHVLDFDGFVVVGARLVVLRILFVRGSLVRGSLGLRRRRSRRMILGIVAALRVHRDHPSMCRNVANGVVTTRVPARPQGGASIADGQGAALAGVGGSG